MVTTALCCICSSNRRLAAIRRAHLTLFLSLYVLQFLIHSTLVPYIVMCSTNRVTLLDVYQYNDTANDYFYREPYCVKLGLQNAGRPAVEDLGC